MQYCEGAGEEEFGRAAAPADARLVLVKRLRARRGEIEEAIFSRISDEWLDRTGSDDPEYVAGMREASMVALDYVLTGIERYGEFLEPVPKAAREQACRAARAGVGLQTVLRRYLAGYAVLEGFVMQEAERDRLLARMGVLHGVLQIVAKLIDRLVASVSRAYNEELVRGEWAGVSEVASSGGVEGSQRVGAGGEAALAVARGRVVGEQRERVMAAIVQVVAERGSAEAPVGIVIERARVSRATFYRLFPGGLEEGLASVIDAGLERVGEAASLAMEGEACWQDRLQMALAVVLVLLDREPELARVGVVQVLGGGPVVVERRERAVREFVALVLAGIQSEVPRISSLAPEGLLASVLAIVRARMIAPSSEPLIGLLGPLMAMLVGYFTDWSAAAVHAQRGERLARRIQAEGAEQVLPVRTLAPNGRGLPEILANPTAQRLRECVLYLAEQGGRGFNPSNRQIAQSIGVIHKSQISKMLSQLRESGLLLKASAGPGVPNEWRLTPAGEEAARLLRQAKSDMPV
jgi:AcrR family transcriptional regulator